MIKPIKIKNRLIGIDQPCFIIAEAGVNHNGKMDLAHRLIEEAVNAGVDAIKFQSFVTEELITPYAPKAKYQVETTGGLGSQHGMLKRLELNAEQHRELLVHCDDLDIIYLCTPYDKISVDNLDRINVPAFKIASTDSNNIPFLQYIATKRRPVLFSTGMSTLGEVELAYLAMQEKGLSDQIAILHCTSEYPAPMNEINLRAILTLQQAFNCPVGFSDHTAGIGASQWAVALGACVVEKHFTLDRAMEGPDHRASIEPNELSDLVRVIREVEVALGDGVKRCTPCEMQNKPFMQKSLVARFDIRTGELLTERNITIKRPGFGLPPSFFEKVIGKIAAKEISADGIIDFSSVVWEKI